MEALQQRIVQLARDAGALADPRLEGHIELVGELADTESMAGPQQDHKCHRTRREEPGGLVKWRKDPDLDECASRVPHTISVGGDDVKCIFARR